MFRVGAVRYSVRVMDQPLVHDGADCFGLCDSGERAIKISPVVEPAKRLGVLIHELTHAWVFEVGRPADIESLCDLCSTITIGCVRDLILAGGEEALRRLRPGEGLGKIKSRIGLLRSRYCQCGGLIAAGDIHCERDENTPDQVTIRMSCDHCNQTMIWNERMEFGGQPSGEVIGEPRIERGQAMLIRA